MLLISESILDDLRLICHNPSLHYGISDGNYRNDERVSMKDKKQQRTRLLHEISTDWTIPNELILRDVQRSRLPGVEQSFQAAVFSRPVTSPPSGPKRDTG